MSSQQTAPENSGSLWIAVPINDRNNPNLDSSSFSFTENPSTATTKSSFTDSTTLLLEPVEESVAFVNTANKPPAPTTPCLLLPLAINHPQHKRHHPSHHYHPHSQPSNALSTKHIDPQVPENTKSTVFTRNKSSVLQQTLISNTLSHFPDNRDKNFKFPLCWDNHNKNRCECGGDCSEDQIRHVHSWVCRVIQEENHNEKDTCGLNDTSEKANQNWHPERSYSVESVTHSSGKMPLQRVAIFQLGMLLMVVPLQFIITKMSSSTESQRVDQLTSVMEAVYGFSNKYLSWESWQKWSSTFYQNGIAQLFQSENNDNNINNDEENAYSRTKENNEFFATSTEPRSPRPSHVHFRVGQVIKHKIWGYRGVIIGWDEVAVAPEYWMNINHPPDKPHWRTMPNYSILVDTRDRLAPQITYVPQENIEMAPKTQIFHPEVDHYFEKFDGIRYLPRPSVRRVYPYD